MLLTSDAGSGLAGLPGRVSSLPCRSASACLTAYRRERPADGGVQSHPTNGLDKVLRVDPVEVEAAAKARPSKTATGCTGGGDSAEAAVAAPTAMKPA